jgi:hypothetical protein
MIIVTSDYLYYGVIKIEFDLSKEFAAKLREMIDSHLINYKYYELRCDEIIENLDEPPYWIIELTSTKYFRDAVKVVNDYAYSEPFVDFGYLELADFYIACLYIKYKHKQISWGTFLLNAGDYSDNKSCGSLDCGDFYFMLNQLEDSEYSDAIEKKQSKEISSTFSKHIKEAERYYQLYLKYFRQYVKRSKLA